ncbi:sulfatase-like hydrolase/transferase [Paenibacillus lutrae]|uniref:Sulfatase-like hydrolase/transferase n=1 Tax=Paenibacillus lutrae TaxID=2078573 RepID=A0A7X3JXR9_9BACL|nr:sulfatase-like hydrolase/transferase [Paenibacillus lutrae]MVO98175.1 sulfatase-like hydrolase/transferase [Paenibacillus lutrae]
MTAPVCKPNIIVFFTDQQRWDTTGIHGNPLGLTPNFDRMAAYGTHVEHAFTCQPVCGPARSCLQTGVYATTSGCYKNGIPLPDTLDTLGDHFKRAGYRTGYIGKWHLAAEEPVPADKRQGYEYWLASNILEFTSDAYSTVVYDKDSNPVRLPGYRVDALTDAAIRYVDGHQEEPFFLFVSYLEPHHQNHIDNYPTPTGYGEQYAGRWLPPDLAALGGSVYQHAGGYYGMVKRLDEALGRLLDALKSLDLEENTIVLFTSDHGNHFKTRNEEYKRSCHEGSIRVPMAFTGPGFSRGRKLAELVSLIDLPPTLLEAAGIEAPDYMQGRSILPLVKGKGEAATEPWPEEVFVQISESSVARAIRTRKWKYGVVAEGKDGNRQPGSDVYTETFLYDLETDPYELTNLAGLDSHREAADVLKARLLRRIVEAGEIAPVIMNAPARAGGQRKVTPQEAKR